MDTKELMIECHLLYQFQFHQKHKDNVPICGIHSWQFRQTVPATIVEFWACHNDCCSAAVSLTAVLHSTSWLSIFLRNPLVPSLPILLRYFGDLCLGKVCIPIHNVWGRGEGRTCIISTLNRISVQFEYNFL